MLRKILSSLHIYPNKNNRINHDVFIQLKIRRRKLIVTTYSRLSSVGFSLIELLIAVSIFSVVSIAIYSTFSSGAAVLRRVKNIDLVQQKILLKQERLAKELRIQPCYAKKLFSGSKTKISFPATKDYIPVRLIYYFDSASSCFMRVEDKLSQIITTEGKIDEELKSSPSIFLSKIKEVHFSYLNFDLKKNEYNWIEEWLFDYLPVAVKLTIFNGNQEYVSTIFLPKK